MTEIFFDITKFAFVTKLTNLP